MDQRDAAAEVGLCLLLAAADGEVSDDELLALTTRIGALLGQDFVAGLEELVERELEDISAGGVDAYVERLPGRIPEPLRFEALRAACEVACADGLSPEEEDMLRDAGKALEVDVAAIHAAIGYRKTMPADGDAHTDEPDERTRVIEDRLGARGWSDPTKELRAAGIAPTIFGASSLEYRSPSGHLLRVEHHTCDGSVHLHVLDASDSGPEYVIFPGGCEADVADAIVAMQDEVSVANAAARVAALGAVWRVCVARRGELVDVSAA